MVFIPLVLVSLLGATHRARILEIFPCCESSVGIPASMERAVLKRSQCDSDYPEPLKDPSLKNLTEIDVSEAYEIQKKTYEKLGKKLENWMDLLDIFHSTDTCFSMKKRREL